MAFGAVEDSVIGKWLTRHSTGSRINEEFCRVSALSTSWIIVAMDPIAVQIANPRVGRINQSVPDRSRPIGQFNRTSGRAIRMTQDEFDAVLRSRMNGKVDTTCDRRGAEWER